MTDRLPEAIGRLVPDLTSESESPTVASFLRGLALGALVGAAIAGSALLQRRRAQAEEQRLDREPVEGGPGAGG